LTLFDDLGENTPMRWLAQVSVLGLFLVSCATAPSVSQSPTLPFGEFIDQVLDPLAGTIADERIQHAQAELNAGQLSPSLLSLLGLTLGSQGSGLGDGFARLQNSSIEQVSAYLDAQRHPLKKEVLALFTKRAKSIGDQYSVCVEGAERGYGVMDGKFLRLADGPGPCDTT
jgi:hypothetical protein